MASEILSADLGVYNVGLPANLTINSFTPTFLNMAGQMGIFRAGTRLGFWDADNSVSWSSNFELNNFEPSLENLAGNTIFGDVQGRIVTIKSYGDGFIIYSTKSIVGVDFTETGSMLWDGRPILSDVGIGYSRAVATGDSDTTHFIYSNSGIYTLGMLNKVAGKYDIKPIFTELYDFLKESRQPVGLQVIDGRFLFFSLIDADYINGKLMHSKGYVNPLITNVRLADGYWDGTFSGLPEYADGNTGFQFLKTVIAGNTGGLNTRLARLWSTRWDGEFVRMETDVYTNAETLSWVQDWPGYTHPQQGPNHYVLPRYNIVQAFEAQQAMDISQANPSIRANGSGASFAGDFLYEFPNLVYTDDLGFSSIDDGDVGSKIYMQLQEWDNFKVTQQATADYLEGKSALIAIAQAGNTEATMLAGDGPIELLMENNNKKIVLRKYFTHEFTFNYTPRTNICNWNYTGHFLQAEQEAAILARMPGVREWLSTYTNGNHTKSFKTIFNEMKPLIRNDRPGSHAIWLEFSDYTQHGDTFATATDLIAAVDTILLTKVVRRGFIYISHGVGAFPEGITLNSGVWYNKYSEEFSLEIGNRITAEYVVDTIIQFKQSCMRDIEGSDTWANYSGAVMGAYDNDASSVADYHITKQPITNPTYTEAVFNLLWYDLLEPRVSGTKLIASIPVAKMTTKIWNNLYPDYSGKPAAINQNPDQFWSLVDAQGNTVIARLPVDFENGYFGGYYVGMNDTTHEPYLITSGYTIGGSYHPPVDYAFTLPGATFNMQAGSINPLYATFKGSLMYDLQLKKWGKYAGDHKLIIATTPVNSDPEGSVSYYNFGVDAGILDPNGSIIVFDSEPADGYISYGKIGYYRLGFNQGLEIRIGFRNSFTGSIRVRGSLDEHSLSPDVDETTEYLEVVDSIVYCNSRARWYVIEISGNYDLQYMEFRANISGRR